MVIKKRSTSIVMVLSELTKRILSSKGAIQYTDCLRMTIKDGFTVVMEEPPVYMNELLDHLGSLGINGARRVIGIFQKILKREVHYRDFLSFGEANLIHARNIIGDIDEDLPTGNHKAAAYEGPQGKPHGGRRVECSSVQ